MPDRDAVYALLQATFITYRDLKSVPIADGGEPMRRIAAESRIRVLRPSAARQDSPDMAVGLALQATYTGDEIYVRAGVLDCLDAVQSAVDFMLPGARLEVVFGYRHPEVQSAFYEDAGRQILEREPGLTGDDLAEAIHRYTAVPEVAGHPTGGAVDVRIVSADGSILPMGTEIGAFDKDSYTFSPFVGPVAWHHRQLLRAAMIRGGFAPFDGEWWHFSYGDREWAKYYNQPAALYDQLDFRA
jgi:D-alanyl-D-alanine dipeptidase